MLLVPVDRDVGHKDAAYAGTQPTSQETEEECVELGGIRDPAMVSGVQPSASLLAGKEEVDEEDEEEEEGDDDEEETTDGEAEDDPSPGAVTFGHRDSKAEQAEWEHIPLPGALQAEVETAKESTTSQEERATIRRAPSASWGARKWRVTNVRRQGSVAGILHLSEETLIFKSERNEVDGNEDATAAGLQQLAGRAWRWRLERLTQVKLAPSSTWKRNMLISIPLVSLSSRVFYFYTIPSAGLRIPFALYRYIFGGFC